MEHNITHAVYAIIGIATIIGAFKGVDWLISLKYKTKDECEQCRGAIYESLKYDSKALTRIETKVDLLMENFNLKPKEEHNEFYHK